VVEQPKRVQLSRRKGWKMPANTVKVARPTRFGNPWTVKGAIEVGYNPAHAQQYCVDLYREWLTTTDGLTHMLQDSDYLRRQITEGLPELRGKNLACWCAPEQPCHADVLLELANKPATHSTGEA
jgi:hypothetical protein